MTIRADRSRRRTTDRPALWLPYQDAWMADESSVRIGEKSRRVGFDYVESFALAVRRITGQTNRDAWYSSADEEAGREFMEYVRDWCGVLGKIVEITHGVELIDGKQVRVMSVRLPAITVAGKTREPRITALSSNPRAFRGKGGDVRISELAFHENQEELWKAAAACTMWGGDIAAWSTHHGEGTFFNRLVEMGRRRTAGDAQPGDVAVSLHSVTLDHAIEQGLAERINLTQGTAYTRESFRSEMFGRYPDLAAAEEELLCKPRSGASSWLPYELMRPCVQPLLPVSKFEKDRRRLVGIVETEAEFFRHLAEVSWDADKVSLGFDVGRAEQGDAFGLAACSRVGAMRRLGPILRLRGARFDIMEGVVTRAMQAGLVGPAGGQVLRGCGDNAGLGMQLCERLETKFPYRFEGINTATPAVREDLWTRPRALAEERTLGLPDDVALLGQFNAVQKIVTAAGKERYAVDRNDHGHADEATACVIALYADSAGSGAYGYPVEVVEGLI
ncbi:MAG: hypothetical protein KDA05_12370 [Phycisphaerales bacterium]|nr:hypothetical protein [Phycisphaerales bacterium]